MPFVQRPMEEQLLASGTDYPLTLTTETKPVVSLGIILLIRVDIGKMYEVGLEVAKETSAALQGIWPWSLTSPNRDVQYLSFVADADSISSIVEKVKSRLKLTEDNLLYSVTPSTRPKEKPPPSTMAT